mmetsp:Transcript_17433/g.22909  ORF Transcript_17433/g.22909 Transcript_17433/m.22909 type:complete len:179 (+) Transcript_17433:131-667(+)
MKSLLLRYGPDMFTYSRYDDIVANTESNNEESMTETRQIVSSEVLSNPHKDTNQKLCDICMESLSALEMNNSDTQCSHVFHSACFEIWQNNTYAKICPICQTIEVVDQATPDKISVVNKVVDQGTSVPKDVIHVANIISERDDCLNLTLHSRRMELQSDANNVRQSVQSLQSCAIFSC